MGRISGFISLRTTPPEEKNHEKAKIMAACLDHRGWNQQKSITAGPVCFSHTPVLNTERSDSQKMSEDSHGAIVLNGALFNVTHLREKLKAGSRPVEADSDTEVLFHSFLRWGEDLLKEVTGVFAFAIYDRSNDTAYLVRDRFGEKPLYYTLQDETLYFASEMPALIRILDDPKINKQSIIEWSLYRNLATSETLLEEICMLAPGHVMKIHKGRIESQRYASPIDSIQKNIYEQFCESSKKEVTDIIDNALLNSVSDCLSGTSRKGTFCSGGVDSSLVTAMAFRSVPDLIAIHASDVGRGKFNEVFYAKQVTEKVGVPLNYITIDKNRFLSELPETIYRNGMPLAHIHLVAFSLISQFAQEKGIQILLTGDAADGQFGGLWHRHRRQKQLLLIKNMFARMPRRLRNALLLSGSLYSGMPYTAIGLEQLIPSIVQSLDRYTRTECRSRLEDAYSFVPNPVDRTILVTMVEDFMDSWDLDRADRLGMAAGIECRSPFAHPKVAHYAFNLPLPYRFNWRTDKRLLKNVAARYLTHQIVYTKKRPWDFPWREYMGPFAKSHFFQNGFCVQTLGYSKLTLQELLASWESNLQLFWNLVNLEIWGRLFIMGESVDQVRSYFVTYEK